MTDKEIADKVYIEPITLEFVTRILRKERPDACFQHLRSNRTKMAMELSKNGILMSLGVELLVLNCLPSTKLRTVTFLNNVMEELDTIHSRIGNCQHSRGSSCLCSNNWLPSYRPSSLLHLVALVVVCVLMKKNCVKLLKMV